LHRGAGNDIIICIKWHDSEKACRSGVGGWNPVPEGIVTPADLVLRVGRAAGGQDGKEMGCAPEGVRRRMTQNIETTSRRSSMMCPKILHVLGVMACATACLGVSASAASLRAWGLDHNGQVTHLPAGND
jgi:hypothetical protein